MTFEHLILETSGAIATITINRPAALNALNQKVLMELSTAFHDVGHRKDIRAIILTGAGEKAFVAGADIVAMSQMTPAQAGEFACLGHMVMNLIEGIKKPVIAAVNGFALGGGMELALACDVIYASETAVFGLPETTLGLFPGFGGTQRLPRLIGKSKAKELIFSGRKLKANEAYEWGIVNKVSPAAELKADVEKLAMAIVANSPVAVGLTKELVNRGTDLPIETGLLLEKNGFGALFTTADMKEGLSAFVEKRKANFKGE